VTQALGAASAYCNARAACPASQDALMQLVASRVCQGKCKYNALMDMAFIQDSKELSSQTVPFLIQVSRHNKIHRSIARAALGGLAYRIPSMANVLLQELDSQLRQTAPQDNNELISIINAIGNSGHATVPQRVAEHLYTQDGEVQNSVVDAMRMVPHQHSQSLYATAVTSSGIDHKAKLAAFQRLIQMNHPAVEDYAPMVKAQLVSCRKGMMKYRNGKCFEMIQGAASPEMNMASEESTSGGISQMAAEKIQTMNVPSKYLINGPIYSGDHTWEKKFGSNTFGGKIWAAMTYALNGKIGLNGNAEEPVAQDELIQNKKADADDLKQDLEAVEEHTKKVNAMADGAAKKAAQAELSKEWAKVEQEQTKNEADPTTPKPIAEQHPRKNKAELIQNPVSEAAKERLKKAIDLNVGVNVNAGAGLGAFVFGTEYNVLSAGLSGRANLMPFPEKKTGETWLKAFEPNYNAEISVTVFKTKIPIWQRGTLPDDAWGSEEEELLQSKAQATAGVKVGECAPEINYTEIWNKKQDLPGLTIVWGLIKGSINIGGELGFQKGFGFGACAETMEASIGAGAGPTAKVILTGSLGLTLYVMSASVALSLTVIETTPTGVVSVGAGFTGLTAANNPKGKLNGAIELKYSQKALGGEVSLQVTFLWWDWKWLIYAWDGIPYDKVILKYDIKKEGTVKVFDNPAKFAEGKDNYASCTSGNQCATKTCAYSSDTKQVCRPNSGFALGKGCYYSTDCKLAKGEYCKDGKNSHSVCVALTPAYGGCTENRACLTKTCQYTLSQGTGESCSSVPNGCACMPPGGFKTATPCYYGKYCTSKNVVWERRRRGPGQWQCS